MKSRILAVAICSMLGGVFSAGAMAGDQVNAAVAARGAKASITAEQRARLSEKLRLIDRIVQAAEPDMQANGTSPDARRWLLESLYKLSLEQVAALGVPGGFESTSRAVTKVAKTTAKAIGSGSTDLVYRPITPCRFIDSRNALGPVVGSRSYDLDFDGGPWGGSAACNPVVASGVNNADDFAAVAINVAIIGPTGAPGFIGARPVGSANSTALVNWYQSGATVQASNAGVISTFQGGGDEIEFFGSTTNIIVDVFGVFTRPDATALECIEVTSSSGSIANGVRAFQQTTCTAGYTAVGGGVETGTNAGSFMNAMAPAGGTTAANGWFASVTNNSGSAQTYTFYAICCRLPGR